MPHACHMLRYAVTVLATAASGSLIATMIASLLLDGMGASSQLGLILGFATLSTIWTVPGVMMLMGFQAISRDLGLTGWRRILVTVLRSATVGYLALAVIGSWQLGLVGAGYGLSCALVLLFLCNWQTRKNDKRNSVMTKA